MSMILENELVSIPDDYVHLIVFLFIHYTCLTFNVPHTNVFHLTKAAREEDSEYGLVDNGRNFDPMFNYYPNGGPRSFPFHMQPREPNMHTGAGSCLTSLSLLK